MLLAFLVQIAFWASKKHRDLSRICCIFRRIFFKHVLVLHHVAFCISDITFETYLAYGMYRFLMVFDILFYYAKSTMHLLVHRLSLSCRGWFPADLQRRRFNSSDPHLAGGILLFTMRSLAVFMFVYRLGGV